MHDFSPALSLSLSLFQGRGALPGSQWLGEAARPSLQFSRQPEVHGGRRGGGRIATSGHLVSMGGVSGAGGQVCVVGDPAECSGLIRSGSTGKVICLY